MIVCLSKGFVGVCVSLDDIRLGARRPGRARELQVAYFTVDRLPRSLRPWSPVDDSVVVLPHAWPVVIREIISMHGLDVTGKGIARVLSNQPGKVLLEISDNGKGTVVTGDFRPILGW